MNFSDILKQTLKDMGMSQSEFARRTNQTPQNLTLKLRRKSIRLEEFMNYMDLLGVKVNIDIEYPDGTKQDNLIKDERLQEKMDILYANVEVYKRNYEYQKELNKDIRTELQSINGYTDLAIKYMDNKDKLDEYLGKMKTSESFINKLFTQNLYEDEKPENPDEDIVKGKKVLVVEDNDLNREIVVEMLKEEGLVAESVVNGSLAFERVKKLGVDYYDFVLMDIQMPVMDGYEATRRIRELENGDKLCIIALSANAEKEDKLKSVQAGMDDHIGKPVDIKELLRILRSKI